MNPIITHPNRRNLFGIGLGLCFLLPPVGILILSIKGLISVFEYARTSNKTFSLMHLYFICLLISSIGASIQMNDITLLCASFMILCYFGIYLSIIRKGVSMNFVRYRWIIIMGGIYNCLLGWALKGVSINPVIGMLTGTTIFPAVQAKNYPRLVGSAYNPNFTMYILLLAIAFILNEVLSSIRSRKWFNSIWQVAVLIMLSKGVLDTGSRAAFFTIVCIFTLFLFQLNKKIFVAVFSLMLLKVKWIIDIMPRSNIINQDYGVRRAIWSNSIELWEHHALFGVTPFGFHKEYAHLFPDGRHENMVHPHNSMIGVFAEYGTFSGILFLLLIVVICTKLITIYFERHKDRKMFETFLFSLPIILLTGIFDEPFFSPQMAIPTIILVAFWNKYSSSELETIPVLSIQKYMPRSQSILGKRKIGALSEK